VRVHGTEILPRVAKMHFRTSSEVLAKIADGL